jgi:hypothetical protein
MKYLTRVTPLLVLVAALAAPALAQDQAADDPFAPGAFEAQSGGAAAATGATAASAFSQPSASSSEAKTEYLVGGSALVSAQATTSASLDGYAASASLSGKLFAKVSVPDFGSLYAAYSVSQAFFEGQGGSAPAFVAPAPDLGSPSYSLAELHYSFDIGKALFVRLGKQLLAWGPSRVWTPVDFVNLRKADAFSRIDLRQGKPGLRLHLPLGKANAFAFADFSGLVAGGSVQDPAKAVDYAVRADLTAGGFELGLTGYAGPNAQAKGGLDFSGDFLGSAVYGELAYAPAYSSYDSSIMASLGISRALGDLKQWTVSLEGFYNSRGSDLSGQPLAMAAAQPLYMGRYYGYASIQAAKLLSPSLGSSLSALANLSDGSYSIRFSEDFAFPKSVPFSLIVSYAGGGAGREFTFFGGDRAISLQAQARVEF